MLPIILTTILAIGQTLQAEIDALVASPPTHVYRLTASHTLDQTLRIPSNIHFSCAEGTVIEAAAGAFKDSGDTDIASLVVLTGVENVKISGCTFRMKGSTYYKDPANGYPVSEYRHTMRVTGSKNVAFENCRFELSGGDGLYVGPLVQGTTRIPCENITVDRCVAEANHRTGLAVVSVVGMSVRDSEFNRTKGTPTNCGIDLEPSHGHDRMANIVIERCKAHSNAASAYMVNLDRQTATSAPVSITFTNCIGTGIPRAHTLIRVEEYGSNQLSVKPKGYVKWDGSSWSNP